MILIDEIKETNYVVKCGQCFITHSQRDSATRKFYDLRITDRIAEAIKFTETNLQNAKDIATQIKASVHKLVKTTTFETEEVDI